MNIWLVIVIVVAAFLILRLRSYEKEEANRSKKWETHPFRNEILNYTISLIKKELTRNLHPLRPNETYSVVIYIYSYACVIGMEHNIITQNSRLKRGNGYKKSGGYCLGARKQTSFEEAGYQNITDTQIRTLGESLMIGLKDQFATDSEILIVSDSYYSTTLEYYVAEVRVDLSKKCKRLKKIDI
ncbi:hypothetical protein D7X33_07395 [Butyricicoccus sp. 1XD8-22]|nr:hypothetical protein D7X33_07395 [Butyricicoccus sp. 1XD8-22]